LVLNLFSCTASAWGADLLDVYHETIASDPRLRRSVAEVAIYHARRDNARAGMLTQITLRSPCTRTAREAPNVQGLDITDYYDGERYYASLNQPIYDKARWEAFRSAGKEARQYSVRHEDFESLVAIDVVDRYTKVLAAED